MSVSIEHGDLKEFPADEDLNVDAGHAVLKQIPVDSVDRNEENPRIMFRQNEMDTLIDSILQYGVQVPISVYRKGSRYVLIDGERRWRCVFKLNRRLIPALVQDKPDPLQNILLMFNIHAAREQWGLFTIALKLRETIEIVKDKAGGTPTVKALATATGLSESVIRRSQLLLEMPEKYQFMLLDEFKKPRYKQRLNEDFFVGMERSLEIVEKKMPDAIDNKDRVRDVLIEKIRDGIIDSPTDFSKVSNIARVENVHADPEQARAALKKLFSDNNLSIKDAYKQSVEEAYSERDVEKQLKTLLKKLHTLDAEGTDPGLKTSLRNFIEEATRLLNELS